MAPTTLADKTYRALGSTILTTPTGLHFTSDKTGHGAVVGVQSVRPF
ncbi:hypothetical protein [Mycobacterium sp. NAZ190054]|nr:hypothetical protein [Mycobacterium sp. NAZ190054]